MLPHLHAARVPNILVEFIRDCDPITTTIQCIITDPFHTFNYPCATSPVAIGTDP
jgi:hypothetical protein